ncbi:MAG: hypothetical protein WBX00_10460, partial [Isosphaeraceae bacterium]
RQRGKRTGSLASASGWYMTFFAAGVIYDFHQRTTGPDGAGAGHDQGGAVGVIGVSSYFNEKRTDTND